MFNCIHACHKVKGEKKERFFCRTIFPELNVYESKSQTQIRTDMYFDAPLFQCELQMCFTPLKVVCTQV